ncbi:MAG: tetratricopeptide repeat protein [Bacillota bacterium]|jgi:tetratricopeptide (TPR) repeat protein
MVMQKIRHSKKKMRVPLIIMVIMLAVGLVGSFAIWSSPNVGGTAGNEIQPEEQIKNLQISIDSLEKDLEENPKDFSVVKSLADARYQQAGLYAQINDREKSMEVFAKGLENYLSALDYAPEDLNEKGRADIMVQAAFCASNSEQANVADALYQQAIELVPEDYTVFYNYVLFLAFYRQDSDRAKAEIDRYKALLPEGDERIAQADQLLEVIKALEEAAQEQENVGQTENTDESGEKDKGEE